VCKTNNNKVMKSKIVFVFAVLLAMLIDSQTVCAQRLVIWQKDGSKVSFNLDEQPKTTFTADNLVITTATSTLNYPLAKIQRYTYEGAALSVRDLKTEGIVISHEGDDIIVKGLATGQTVAVYRMDGTQLLTKRSDDSGRLILSLGNLPTGVYMIKVNEITYKFLKR